MAKDNHFDENVEFFTGVSNSLEKWYSQVKGRTFLIVATEKGNGDKSFACANMYGNTGDLTLALTAMLVKDPELANVFLAAMAAAGDKNTTHEQK